MTFATKRRPRCARTGCGRACSRTSKAGLCSMHDGRVAREVERKPCKVCAVPGKWRYDDTCWVCRKAVLRKNDPVDQAAYREQYLRKHGGKRTVFVVLDDVRFLRGVFSREDRAAAIRVGLTLGGAVHEVRIDQAVML